MRSMIQSKSSVALAAATIATAFAAPSAFAAEYANVVSSTAVISSVPTTRQICSDSQQLVQSRPSGAGAVIGAIAGGVLGNTVGGGFGRAAATGLGAVAGAVVGDNVEANNSAVAAVPVRRCQNVTSYEQRTVGYDVVYEYAGQRYSTRMARDPGRQFAIAVQPADGGTIAVPSDARNGSPVPPAYVSDAPAQVVVAQPQTYYYDPLPQQVYYGSPYYGPSYYAAPVIGLGIGLGLGYAWRGGGYRGGYGGGWGHHGR